DDMTAKRQTSPTLKRVLRVLDYIHDHASEELSLDTLADVAALSRFHWHRVFSALMGASPNEVIRFVRMHKATLLLVQSDAKLSEIARQVGYPNPRSFSRVFRQVYGVTPSAFRQRRKTLAPPYPNLGDTKMFDVEVKQSEPCRLAAITHEGAYPEISRAFQRASTILAAGEHWGDTRGMVGVYYDDPTVTPVDKLKSHAGAIWTGQDVPDGLEDVSLEGGKYAVLKFKGPYSGLPSAYTFLYGTWIASSPEALRDAPSFEVYLNSPLDTPAEELLTEIHMPLV
ncbi:MAG: AraC family transcriptional regulator, partial [Pseudomonadota bacterium]